MPSYDGVPRRWRIRCPGRSCDGVLSRMSPQIVDFADIGRDGRRFQFVYNLARIGPSDLDFALVGLAGLADTSISLR
eukprot:scaffold374000_cov34-Prasinocladus_malaysianus.AAC.1